MTETGALVGILFLGLALGALFFGGLWWTVRRAMASRHVALWFFGSLLLRTLLVLGGFYWGCGDNWQRWLVALLGFAVARWLVTRLTRSASVMVEGEHAS